MCSQLLQCIIDASKSEKVVFEAMSMNEELYQDPEVFELRDPNIIQQTYGKTILRGVHTL